MMEMQIFVEGDSDKKFIEDYLKFLDLAIETEEMGGIGKLNLSRNIFITNNIEGIQNILILDADGDYSTRKEEIEEFIATLGFDVPFFLFPNNQSNGDLESLLENIIHDDNRELFDCWDNYIGCLDSKNKGYSTPNRKAKIFAYLEALLGESRKEKKMLQENSRNYLAQAHWNLNSSYLNPLKDFLKF